MQTSNYYILVQLHGRVVFPHPHKSENTNSDIVKPQLAKWKEGQGLNLDNEGFR